MCMYVCVCIYICIYMYAYGCIYVHISETQYVYRAVPKMSIGIYIFLPLHPELFMILVWNKFQDWKIGFAIGDLVRLPILVQKTVQWIPFRS